MAEGKGDGIQEQQHFCESGDVAERMFAFLFANHAPEVDFFCAHEVSASIIANGRSGQILGSRDFIVIPPPSALLYSNQDFHSFVPAIPQ